MKVEININGKSVEIELTAEQVAAAQKKSVVYTDIKTFKDACDFLGVDTEEFEETYSSFPNHVYAYMQLTVISQALNGGDHMTYDNTNEHKYYPYFNAKGSSVGFSCSDYLCVNTYSYVGSRLTYKSREIAEYAGRTFIDIYNKYIN